MKKLEINEQIRKIHNEFFTAADALVLEAETFKENKPKVNINKAERLKALGFGIAKEVKDVEEILTKEKEYEHKIQLIKMYKQKYPLYRFITEDQIEKICDKYNLYDGPSSAFIGFIPEKNLQDIENFKCNVDDLYQGFDLVDFRDSLVRAAQLMREHAYQFSIEGVVGKKEKTSSAKVKNEKPQYRFLICAPEKDFKIDNYKYSKKGRQIVPDPIVTVKVKGGRLIVTAWGDEASDSEIINESNN